MESKPDPKKSKEKLKVKIKDFDKLDTVKKI